MTWTAQDQGIRVVPGCDMCTDCVVASSSAAQIGIQRIRGDVSHVEPIAGKPEELLEKFRKR